jgi:hypothetical protein
LHDDLCLLGRTVGECHAAEGNANVRVRCPRRYTGDAEVGDLRFPDARQKHVGRLDVLVDHAARVREREAPSELHSDVEHPLKRVFAGQPSSMYPVCE